MARATANSPISSGNYHGGSFRLPKATVVKRISEAKAVLSPDQYATMEYKGYHDGYKGHVYLAKVDGKNKRIVVG